MPFLKNTWYVAANASELDEGLVSRTICNELIVMFRTASGDVAALEDRCPHRFVPLSMGKRVGDTLECGYHGLRFDAKGACADKPNDADNQNLNPCVRAYPAVERYGVVWLWMGQAELADPAKIPEFTFMTDKRFGVAQGYSHIKGNSELLADNLLDLSHIHYLHPQIRQGSSEFASFKNEVRVEGETIWSMLWRPNQSVDPARRAAMGWTSDKGEGQGHSRWDAPGVLLVFTGFWEVGKSYEEGVQTPSAHLLTPETEFTTHYFWAAGRNYDIENEEMTRGTAAMMKIVFETQDGPMIEAQQRMMGATTDFLEQKPVILRADAAGVMARRLMKRKIKEEAGQAAAVRVAAE